MRRAKLTKEYLETLGFICKDPKGDWFYHKVNGIGITVIFNKTYVAIGTYSSLPVNVRPDKYRTESRIKYRDEFTRIWDMIKNEAKNLEEEDFIW